MAELTQEWILKTFASFGFKESDAEVYISLTRNGSQKARDVADKLKTHRREVYRSLKKLKAKGIVYASIEHPALFSALSFEKVLDSLIRANVEEAKRLEQEKEKILKRWRTIIKEDSTS